MSTYAIPCAAIAKRFGGGVSLRRVTVSMLQSSISIGFACALAGCSGAPVEVSKHVGPQRILPSANGFVICVDCAPFQPTVKQHDSVAKGVEVKVVPPIPVALSLSANEQIVPDRPILHADKPRSLKIFFETNGSRISTSDAQLLRSFLDSTVGNGSYKVTGYTDGTGRLASNVRLATRRAAAVKDFIVRSGNARHVIISSNEHCCPDGEDLTETDRATNRHVEITVIP